MELTCPKCHRVFEGEADFAVNWAFERHTNYCLCPKKYQILGSFFVLPGMVVLAAAIIGMLLYFIFAPLAFPFICGISVLMEEKIPTWAEYSEKVYGKPPVRSYKPKEEK